MTTFNMQINNYRSKAKRVDATYDPTIPFPKIPMPSLSCTYLSTAGLDFICNLNLVIAWSHLATTDSFYARDGNRFFVKLSLSLYSLSLRESLHYNHSVPPTTHSKLFKNLRVDLYSSVIHHWNRQLKPYWVN